MQVLRKLHNGIISGLANVAQIRGIKYFAPPQNYDDITIPEKPKLKLLEKVPQYPSNVKPPRMQKRLRYMRGPELIHNTLQYKQYAIIATCGGRMKYEHFEIIRLGLVRKLDFKRMFAIWRVDPPWQPITRKGQGQRMGGGKGAIDHYVTPVKKDRVIVEVAGKCEFIEVKKILEGIAVRMPFDAKVVSQEMLDKEKALQEKLEKANVNPYTFEYLVRNNMQDCKRWLTPYDRLYFRKYL